MRTGCSWYKGWEEWWRGEVSSAEASIEGQLLNTAVLFRGPSLCPCFVWLLL